MPEAAADTALRLDKWLWAARFFKTRALAADAVKGGKVDLNGHKAKPAAAVRPGDWLRIRRDAFEFEIRVEGISRHRGPAGEAALLYSETEASRERRAQRALEIRADAAGRPHYPGRPTKKDRRRIIRFRRSTPEA